MSAIFAVAVAHSLSAQARRNVAGNPPLDSHRSHPAPTNLKVLPKEMSGKQVYDTMVQWSADLGVECDACHSTDSSIIVTGGPARSRFAADSKGMKQAARLMYSMTEEINASHIARVEGSGMPVTCGTCHRGRLSPEPFAAEPADGRLQAHVSQDGQVR